MIRKGFLGLIVLSLLTLASIFFQSAQAEDSPAGTPAAAHFNPDAATAAYLSTMTAAERTRSDAYFEGGYWLTLWDFSVGLTVAWALLRWRFSTRMRDLAVRITRLRWAQTAFYASLYFLVTTLVTLPWAAYEGLFRERQYGMSNQGLGSWMGDQAKELVITLIFGALAAVAIYAVIRKFHKTWWLWGSSVAILFLIFQIAIGPTYLEPAFNKFYPLPESALKQHILSLARANGIPVEQVYEFDASKQTTKMSAHVSGVAGSAQISLNDNLIIRASPEEVEAVLGHEMGHYVLNHSYKGILAVGVLVVISFAFMSWGFRRVTDRFGERWIYAFVLTPVFNTITRSMEAEADAFGLNAARQPDGAAQAALHLAEYRKMQPGAIEEIIFFDHPSGWNRIHRSMIWKAENLAAADMAAYDTQHRPPGMGR